MITPGTAGPRFEEPGRYAALRQIAKAYATDLMVCIALVVVFAGVLGETAGGTSPLWVFDLRASLAQFTPFGLWQIYRGELLSALDATLGNVGSGMLPNVMAGPQVLSQVVLALPATVLVIYRETDTLIGWCLLLLFSTVSLATFGMLMCKGWLSLVRLLLAAAASPICAAVLFWLIQHTVLDILDGLSWFASIGFWCLLCPLACTVYWVLFPTATEGATARCIHLLSELNLPLWRVPAGPRRARTRHDPGAA